MLQKIVIRHRNRLNRRQSVRLQAVVADLEIGVVVMMPHRLDHFNRNQFIERARQIPVILEQQRDAVAQSGLPKAFLREIMLLARNRRRRDAAAVLRGGMEREPAPARADFQNMIVWRQAQLLTETVVFGDRRLLERGGFRLENAAGIGHGVV